MTIVRAGDVEMSETPGKNQTGGIATPNGPPQRVWWTSRDVKWKVCETNRTAANFTLRSSIEE